MHLTLYLSRLIPWNFLFHCIKINKIDDMVKMIARILKANTQSRFHLGGTLASRFHEFNRTNGTRCAPSPLAPPSSPFHVRNPNTFFQPRLPFSGSPRYPFCSYFIPRHGRNGREEKSNEDLFDSNPFTATTALILSRHRPRIRFSATQVEKSWSLLKRILEQIFPDPRLVEIKD